MKLTSLLPWFGSKRTMAPEIVRQLGEHNYYFECCAGSMAVLFAKQPAHHETVCDLHGGLTNLAWCLQNDDVAKRLFGMLQRTLYSESLFRESKALLENCGILPNDPKNPCLGSAYHYFIASWMGRNGVSGTAMHNYQMACRWTANGGSGPLRFRNAVDSIPAWCDRLRNVLILRRDLFEVLPRIEDADGVSIYADPPYLPETMGKSRYLHDFTADHHKQLAKELGRFKRARVVCSYYDAPKLDELYPRSRWVKIDCSRHKHLHCQNLRGSKRTEAPEVLLVNGDPIPLSSKVDHATLFE